MASIANILAVFSVLLVCASFASAGDAIRRRGDDYDDEDKGSQYLPGEVEPVKLKVLVESLCPGCRQFMLKELFPTYQLLGPAAIDLEVVVFGNAQIDVDAKELDCQHGPAECDANSYEQCAVAIYPHAYRYLPYLHCLDEELEMGYHDEKFDAAVFSKCARKSTLDFQSIKECHNDKDQAWKLQKEASEQTSDHDYVPWVEINGKHTFDEDKDDLFTAICKAYRKQNKGQSAHPLCPKLFAGETLLSMLADAIPMALKTQG